MKVFKKGLGWRFGRYAKYKDFEDVVNVETERMCERLWKQGIFVYAAPVVASAKGPKLGDDRGIIFVGGHTFACSYGPNPNSENNVLIRQLTRNFSQDAGEAARKEIETWS